MQPIKDFMASPVISIDAQAMIEAVAKLMREKKISALLVKEGEEYVGIITKTDIINKVVAESLDPKTTPVHSIMSTPILGQDQYAQRSDANIFMLRHNIKHLAVTQGKKILGILTTKDMVS